MGQQLQTTLQLSSTLQKRAIQIVNNVGYHEHTNILYLKWNTLKFKDLVDFKTAQIIFEAKNKLLPRNNDCSQTERGI